MAEFITVTVLNRIAKGALAQCEPLSELIVCGEVSNFTKHYKSGHCYFSLKDENSTVRAVMFRDSARLLNFAPANGMMVLAYGHATLYERDGAFQLYVDYMRPFGSGAAQMAFDALKAKLEKEGLFDVETKKPLPAVPSCIGVVSSKTGAALQDVIHVISRRWPSVRLLLAPVSVQGLAAEASIVEGIRTLDADPRPDVILVTRGGGSKEDLWVFNSEKIARAAFSCHKPVVSAVGHEIDYTILDYVADLRAPTPSAAAEVLVPDRQEYLKKIFILRANIHNIMQLKYKLWYNRYKQCAATQLTAAIQGSSAAKAEHLIMLSHAMKSAMDDRYQACSSTLGHAADLAQTLSPYSVLARGYSVVKQPATGQSLPVHALHADDEILVCGSDASAQCRVLSVTKNKEVNAHEKAEKL